MTARVRRRRRSGPRRATGAERGPYDPAATRRMLLDSALRLFEARGYDATSVDELVAGAGVTKGAFYHHFASKDDVLRSIHDAYIDDRLEGCRRIVAAHQRPAEQLAHLIREAIVHLETYRRHVTVYLQERRFLTEERFVAVKRKRDELHAIYEDVVHAGVTAGVFRKDLDTRVVTLGILGMCAWVVTWFRPGRGLSAAEIGDQLAGLVIVGLGTGRRGRAG